jgi:hypothetical protein
MDRKPKRLLDNLEFFTVVLGLIFLPELFLLVSDPAAPYVLRWIAAPAFGAYAIWIVVRGIYRRLDPRHAKRLSDDH